MEKIKSGFVSIIGRPNVGKSSFLNYVLEKKISIVTPKAQTTRNTINGIYNKKNLQIVFIDTPGVHTVKNELDRQMNSAALKSSKGVDVILFLAPANERIGKNDLFLIKNLKERNEIKIILGITKIDLVNSQELTDKIQEWKNQDINFSSIICFSSKTGQNIDKLITEIKEIIPETNFLFYPDDTYTDQPDRFLAREVIREEILLQTSEEVPHSVAILIEKFNDEEKILKISASIIVERNSQKGIIIGKQGRRIKEIGTKARIKLESIFELKVFLELYVKIKENWKKSPSLIKKMVYDIDTY